MNYEKRQDNATLLPVGESEVTMRCKSLSETVGEVNRLIDEDREKLDNICATYCFRGERRNFLCDSDDSELGTGFDSLLDRLNLQRHERELYEEALRYEVASFEHDRTIIERLARMQHYGLPTRFADLSQNALLSVHFALGSDQTCPGERDNGRDGFVRVIRISEKKMKSYTSDIIVAISHLPCVEAEDVDPFVVNGLGKLSYAVQNDQPAFHDERQWPEIGEQLRKDIQQVWAFKPILNSARIRNQSGVFLAFGCGRHKEPLKPTFSLADYDNEQSPSWGIAQIGYVQIAASAKKRIREELRRFGMEPERVFPELSNVCQEVRRRCEEFHKEDFRALQEYLWEKNNG